MKIKQILGLVLLAILPLCSMAQGLSVMHLPNGATVYLWEDKSKPDVYGMVSFKVGSVDDPLEYTGLAHYLEHVMFKGTQTIGTLDWEKESALYQQIIAKYDEMAETADPAQKEKIGLEINDLTIQAAKYSSMGEFSQLVDQMGGQGLNASTGYDQTEYHNSFPPAQLEKWLMLYSERLINPVFRGFQTELEAVYEEFNMYSDNPGSNMREWVMAEAFEGHPYARPIIGKPEHLKNPRLSKLIDFYNQWYGPENMAIILVGNFDTKTTVPMIRNYFGQIAKRAHTERPAYPIKKFSGRTEKSAKLFYYPMLYMVYNGVEMNHADDIALEVCMEILSNSQSTGMLDKLTIDGNVMAAFASSQTMRDAGIISVGAIPSYDPSQNRWESHKSVEKQVLAIINTLKKKGVDEELLESVKRNMICEYELQMESNEFKAMYLAQLFNTGADPADIVNYREKVAAITADQIRDVANRYFTKNYLALNIQQQKGHDNKKEKLPKPAYKPVESEAGVKSEYAQWFESIPVNVEEPTFCDLNSVAQRKVNSRSRIFYTKNPENDVFTLTLKYGVGTTKMPKLGYAVELMNNAGMMPDVDAQSFKREMSKLGATCYYSVDGNYLYITIRGYEEGLAEACRLLSKQILFPRLEDVQLQTVINNTYSARNMEKDNNDVKQDALTQYVLFKDKSTYLDRLPLREVIDLTKGELTTVFQEATNYACDIHYVGTADESVIFDILSKNLPIKAEEMASTSPEERPREQYGETTIFFLADNKATQSNIGFYIEGKPYNVNDGIDISAFSAYFGSGFGSMVMDEIREKRAMAYTAYGVVSTPMVAGRNTCFVGYVGTQGDKTIDAIDVYMNLLNEMPIVPSRFESVKTNIKQSILSSKPTFRNESQVYEAWKMKGYTEDPAILQMQKIEALQFENIVNYYKENIQGKPVVITIVGNPKDFNVNDLEKYGKVVKVNVSKLFSDDSL